MKRSLGRSGVSIIETLIAAAVGIVCIGALTQLVLTERNVSSGTMRKRDAREIAQSIGDLLSSMSSYELYQHVAKIGAAPASPTELTAADLGVLVSSSHPALGAWLQKWETAYSKEFGSPTATSPFYSIQYSITLLNALGVVTTPAAAAKITSTEFMANYSKEISVQVSFTPPGVSGARTITSTHLVVAKTAHVRLPLANAPGLTPAYTGVKRAGSATLDTTPLTLGATLPELFDGDANTYLQAADHGGGGNICFDFGENHSPRKITVDLSYFVIDAGATGQLALLDSTGQNGAPPTRLGNNFSASLRGPGNVWKSSVDSLGIDWVTGVVPNYTSGTEVSVSQKLTLKNRFLVVELNSSGSNGDVAVRVKNIAFDP